MKPVIIPRGWGGEKGIVATNPPFIRSGYISGTTTKQGN